MNEGCQCFASQCCPYDLLVSAPDNTLPAAQLQVEGTLQAAVIAKDVALQQVAATVEAASIQGWFTLIAGVCALIAGVLAYRAAARQIRIEEGKQKSLKLAYKHRILALLEDLKLQIANPAIWGAGFNRRPHNNPIPHFSIHIPNDLNSDHWQDHALLPVEIVQKLYTLHEKVKDLSLFLNEVREKNLTALDVADNSIAVDQIQNDDGSVKIIFADVGTQFSKQPCEITELLNNIYQEIKAIK